MYRYLAKSYNELHKEEQIKKLEIIRKYIKIIPPLLDIGCGTGISTNYFNVESFGIDNCKEMIKESNSKNLIYGNAEKLFFKDKTFNTIISVTSFHNFKNMERALIEIKRVSRNDNIAITFLKKSSKINKFRELLKKYSKFKEIDCYNDILFLIFVSTKTKDNVKLISVRKNKSKIIKSDYYLLDKKLNSKTKLDIINSNIF